MQTVIHAFICAFLFSATLYAGEGRLLDNAGMAAPLPQKKKLLSSNKPKLNLSLDTNAKQKIISFDTLRPAYRSSMKPIILKEVIENAKSKKLADSLSLLPLHPIFKTPLLDTAKKPYKRIDIYETFLSPAYTVNKNTLDFQPHRGAEDLFEWFPHVFLRDKQEFGQFNEMVINGLGKHYQQIIIDDISFNDPVTMKANWQMLTAEEFEDFSIMRGFESFSKGGLPITINFETADYVAALGYTHLRIQDFDARATQVNTAFSLNLSDKLNFYGNYTIETNAGMYINGVTESPFALHHKLNARFRYQIAPRTYFILSGGYRELNIVPYGGVNLETSSSLINKLVFSYAYAFFINTAAKAMHSAGNVKAEFIIPTFSIDDYDNQLKVWVNTSVFNQDYFINKVRTDSIFAIRTTVGASQVFSTNFFKIIASSEFDWDHMPSLNMLQTSVPNATSLLGSVLGQFNFADILDNIRFTASGSFNATLYNRAPSGEAVFSGLGTSWGASAKVTFEFPNAPFSVNAFGNTSFSSRLSSIEETYGHTSVVSGIGRNVFEDIFMLEIGGRFLYSDPFFRFDLTASLNYTSVANPISLVKNVSTSENATLGMSYSQLAGQTFSYNAVSMGIKMGIWKIELDATGTLTLDYHILNNMNTDAYLLSFPQGVSYEASRSNKNLFYLPRIHGILGIYFHSKIFYEQLDFKGGVVGRGSYLMSNALQTTEQVNETYFNLYNDNGTFYDNNIASGASSFMGKLDIQLFLGFRQISFFIFWENLLNIRAYTLPAFVQMPSRVRFGVSWIIID